MSKRPDSSTSGWTRLTSVIDQFRSSLFEDTEAASDAETEVVTAETTDPTATSDTVESDRAVVIRALRERNGRIRQSTLVTQTDWSASKVSRLLTSMESRGTIERVRVGRGKVVLDADQNEE